MLPKYVRVQRGLLCWRVISNDYPGLFESAQPVVRRFFRAGSLVLWLTQHGYKQSGPSGTLLRKESAA